MASDADGNSLQFSLAGADASFFRIDASGVIRASKVLDFDNPRDSNGDNVYNLIVRVSDGTASSEASLSVTVTNITNDGLTKIEGDAQGDALGSVLSRAPDFDRDGIQDIFLSTFKTPNAAPVQEGVSYLVFSSAVVTEQPQTLQAGSLAIDGGVEFLVDGLSALPSGSTYGPIEIVEGIAPPPIAATGAFSLISHPLASPGVSAVTAILRAAIPDITAAGGQINLNATPLFSGLRSSRNNLEPTAPGEIRTAGDFNGDTVTDFAAQYTTIEHDNGAPQLLSNQLVFFSGREMLTGGAGLFDVTETTGGEAVILEDSDGTYWYPLRDAADVDGDNADDIVLYGGSFPTQSIIVVSGRTIFDDADGFVDIASIAADTYRITSNQHALFAQWAGLGDFNGDGKPDLIVTIAEQQNSAFIIYNDGIALDADGDIAIENVPPAQMTRIDVPNRGFLSIGVSIGDVDGGGADDILFGAPANKDTYGIISAAYILLGESLDPAGTQIVNVASAVDSGDAVLILAPPQNPANIYVSDNFGLNAARMGDVDGDGLGELVIGAGLDKNNVGAAYVMPTTLLKAYLETGETLDLGEVF